MTNSDAPPGWSDAAAEPKTSPQMRQHLVSLGENTSVYPETQITAEMNRRLVGENEFDDPEPVFVFRGQDALALDAIWFYERMCARMGLTDQAEQVRAAIDEIEHWQSRNPGKVKNPDHKHVPASEA